MDDTLILTPSALFTFLSQIDELKDKTIDVSDDGNQIVVMIGDKRYVLKPGSEVEDVDSEIVDVIDEINDDGYETANEEIVEGGILKELIKTLAIGGLVRLTKGALTS